MTLSLITPPQSYKEKIAQYSKLDFALSLLVFVLYILAMALCGTVEKYLNTVNRTLLGIAINLVFTALVFVFVKKRGEKLNTLGLTKQNVKLSLLLGGVLSLFLFFCNCLSNILFENQHFIQFNLLLLYFVYFFSVSLCEEVMFRGYILTRLHAITKKVYLDVILAGVLFVFMHFPFRMVAYKITFWQFISNVPYMLNLFITHLVLAFIRIKTDNLWGAILPHWVSNFAYNIVTH